MRYTQLNRPTMLAHDDEVIFEVHGDRELVYTVGDRFLSCRGNSNSAVFYAMGINEDEMAREAYGYAPHGGDWPTARTRDYAGMTRLVNLIYTKITGVEDSEVPLLGDSKARVNIPDNIKEGLQFILTLKRERPEVSPLEVWEAVQAKAFQGYDLDSIQNLMGVIPTGEVPSYIEYAVAMRDKLPVTLVKALPSSFKLELLAFILAKESCMGSALRGAFPDYDPNAMQFVADELRSEGLIKLDYTGYSIGSKVKVKALLKEATV